MTLTNYWWLLIWMFTGGLFCKILIPTQREYVMGKLETRWSWLAAIILSIPYVIWAGFRPDTFGDTAVYRENFLNAPQSLSQISIYFNTLSKDKGFYTFVALIRCLITDSDIVCFLIIASIQIFIVVRLYRKYSIDFWFAMFVFIATTDYLSWTYNGVRQFTAVCLVYAGTSLYLEKRYIRAFLLIIFAATFHGTAIMMIPLIIVLQGKAWNKKTLLMLGAACLALVFVNQFTSILQAALEDTQYTNVVNDWQSWNDDGINPIRVLVYSVPTILSVVGLRHIQYEDDPVINFATNASIATTGLGIIAMGTSGIFLGRLPIYVSLYANGILLPWEIKNIFSEKSAGLIRIGAICAYIVFFYYQMHATWGIM